MTRTRLLASAVALGGALLAGPALADYSAGKSFYDSGRYNEAANEFYAEAEQGHALAQYMMGRLHQEGRGADRDLVQAYMWYSLAGSNGYYPAVTARDALAPAMTSAQRTRAQQMAADWRLSHPTRQVVTASQPTTQAVSRAVPAYEEPYSLRAVQRVLNELGYAAGPVDGIMGGKTRSAIRAYQLDNGLPVSGQPSRALYDALIDSRVRLSSPTVAQPQPQATPQPQPAYDAQLIVALQTELRRRGYDVPTVSGNMDYATTSAIRAYQADAGLAADGRPSPLLLAHLRTSPSGTAPTMAYRDQVRTVQSLLNVRGYNAGPADGVMGPSTREAIRTYQADAGLPVTGQVSASLIAELQTGTDVGGVPSVDQPDEPLPEGQALVRAVEYELAKLGYDVEEVDDGRLQRKSRQALREFQRDAGLEVTVDVTPELLQVMRSGWARPGTTLAERYRAIEERLAQKGYDVGPVDGVIDAQARAAIESYQADAGMAPAGYPTQQLREHLASSSIRAETSTSTLLEIERELQRRRYSVGPIDGVIDSRTRFGIETYQRHAALPITGQPSASLLSHMRANPNLTAFVGSTLGSGGSIIDLTQ